MKEFLKKVYLFILFIFSYFILIYFLNLKIVHETIPNLEANVVILGASDIQGAIDPSYFRSARNIAQMGEPYFVSHWKLQHLLRNEENKIDTLFLGFNNLYISGRYDEVLSTKFANWSTYLFRIIYPIVDFNTVSELEVDWFNFYKLKFKYMCLFLKVNHNHFIGKYANYNSQINSIDNFMINIDRHYYHEKEQSPISIIALKNISAIKQICVEKNIKLILVAPPVHANYFKKIPKKFIQYFEEVKASFEEEGVLVFDYRASPYADTEFYDSCHLNGEGAKRFTKKLRQDIENLK